MTNDRMSGLALIAGSAGVIITLSLHPSGHELFQKDLFEAAARKMIAVHSIALFSLPIWFLGTCGLARRLSGKSASAALSQSPLSFSGLVLYGFAMAAILNGVILDGLVTPGIAGRFVDATGAAADSWRIILRYNGIMDEAFLRVFFVASSISIFLWSLLIVHQRTLPRATGVFGLILAVATVVALLSGMMDRYAHIFGMVLIGQALWSIAAGISLCRAPSA